MKHRIENLPQLNSDERLEALIALSFETGDCLDLSNNLLCTMKFHELTAFLQLTPDKVQAVDFGYNSLHFANHKELINLIQRIPGWISSVSLQSNYLDWKTPLELAEMIAAIPNQVNALDLSNNRLTDAQVLAILPALSQTHIKMLALEGSLISEKTICRVNNVLRTNRIGISYYNPNLICPINSLFGDVVISQSGYFGITAREFNYLALYKSRRERYHSNANEFPIMLDKRCKIAEEIIKNPPIGYYDAVKDQYKNPDSIHNLLPFFGWAAVNNRADLVNEEAFKHLVLHYPDAALESFIIAVTFGAKEYAQTLIKSIDKSFIGIGLCIAVLTNDISMLDCILKTAKQLKYSLIEITMSVSKNYGRDPLNMAIKNQNVGAVACLLENGIAPNSTWNYQDIEDYLHFAAKTNNPDIIELLIKFGADINKRDYDKKTAFDYITNLETRISYLRAVEETNRLNAQKTPIWTTTSPTHFSIPASSSHDQDDPNSTTCVLC